MKMVDQRILVIVILSLLVLIPCNASIPTKTQRLINKANKDGPYLGLVIPNMFEMNPLLQHPSFKPTNLTIDFAGKRFRFGTIYEEKVVLVMTGLAMLNAGVTTQLLLSLFNIKGVVHYGIAGNANTSLNIGDVTIPKYWSHTSLWNWQRYGDGPENELALEANGDYTRRIGYLKFANYATNISDNLLNNVWYQPEEIFPINGVPEQRQHAFWVPINSHYLQISKKLEGLELEKCVNSTTCLSISPKVTIVSKGGSANIFLDNAAYRNYLNKKFKISPVDMESAAVALVCHQQRVPFVVFRALSDLAGGGSAQSNEAAAFAPLAANNSVAVVVEFVRILASLGSESRYTKGYMRRVPMLCLTNSVSVNSGGPKSDRLENIEEENSAEWVSVACPQPETPTESMEFLARSWSVSAVELSKALCNTHVHVHVDASKRDHLDRGSSLLSQNQPLLAPGSPPDSPRGSDDTKELLLLHQALNPEFLSLRNNGHINKTIIKKKTMGRWIKDQKERKKQEIRAHNAQLHAAVSVAGVAAAVAALAASSLASPEKLKLKKPSKRPAAIASAAALVASHCIEIAEDLGADRDHILAVVHSAINARTNGDVMTLTAGAATALRGAATMRARLHRENGVAALADESVWNGKESSVVSTSLNFVYKGGELLKRTRKGDLHWKQVSFNINSNWQVVAKMKSKHIGGTFTKKKKCVVCGVYSDIRGWPGREGETAYFAVETAERVIEFECRNKEERQMWVEGIQNMLHLHGV